MLSLSRITIRFERNHAQVDRVEAATRTEQM